MMRNKKTSLVLFKKRVSQKRFRLDFYLNYMAPSYFLAKNSFMFNKFFRKFFSFHFFFFKKLWLFAKTFATGQIFYRFFILEQKKYVFGNCFKFNKNYKLSEHDELFFFFKKKKLASINGLFFNKVPAMRGFSSNFFYINAANLVNLPDCYENLENFFYKGEIYANWLDPSSNDNFNLFLETFNFDYICQYNLFFLIEIYKIHINIILKNLLIILYSYLKKKAHLRV